MLQQGVRLAGKFSTPLAVTSVRNYIELPGTRNLTRGTPRVVPTGKSPHVSGIVATVFGSTGFVGRYVVSALGEQGSQVVIPYRGTENTFRHLKVCGDLGQIVPMECDVWKPEQIEEVCAQSNLVINLIGSRWHTKNFSMDDTNNKIAENIAQAAKRVGVSRMIHISALGAKEDAVTEFGRSKWRGERSVLEAFPEATIIRPSTLFGYEDHLLVKWAGILKYWPFVPLIGDTLYREEAPLAASDLALIIKHCVSNPQTMGRLYEVDGPVKLTTRELIDLVRNTTYLETPEVNVPFELMNFVTGCTQSFLRKPRFTKDELLFLTTNNLAFSSQSTIRELNVSPLDIRKVAVKYIRHFRRAKFINEM